MRHFPRIVVTSLALLLALSACGQKGPLKLPEPAATPASTPPPPTLPAERK
jgi:predicted small lipoprotein YifL